MAAFSYIAVLTVLNFSLSVIAQDSFFFNGTDFAALIDPDVSSKCAEAMQSPIDCEKDLTYVMTSDYWGTMGNDTIQQNFCRTSCGTGLANYLENVKSACSNDPQPLPGYPATYWGDSASAAWNQMCLKDSATGQYCSEFVENLFAQAGEDGLEDGNIATNIPDDKICSDCVIQLFKHLQSTPYSNYDDSLAEEWLSIQKKCGLSLPTSVPALQVNVSQPGGFAAPGTTKSGCLSGKSYLVVAGDDCNGICKQNSCSTGTLKAINDIYTDCSNLRAGMTLCLPSNCTTYSIASGDTCQSIATANSKIVSQLLSWNPAIEPGCSNIFSGENMCISPPGGIPILTAIAGATVTQTAIFATATAARPTPVGQGTTVQCGRYHQVHMGDACQLIAMNQTIALGLFYGMNPSINDACSNLEVGVYYCVQPTREWNTSASSTIATAPTTTPSGTAAECYEYYVIQSGDFCGRITDLYGITMVQFSFWNPTLNADCSNLLLGQAYCVHAANQVPQGNSAPAQTAAVKRAGLGVQEGGVPYGWPGLTAPRLRSGAGLG